MMALFAVFMARTAVCADESSVLLWFVDNVPGVDNGEGVFTEIKDMPGWSAAEGANNLAVRVCATPPGGASTCLALWYYDASGKSFVKDLGIQESWINGSGQSGVNFSPIPEGIDLATASFAVELGNLADVDGGLAWFSTLAVSKPVKGVDLSAWGHVSPGELAIPDHTPWSDFHLYEVPELQPVTAPVVHVYDGTVYAPTVTLPEELSYEWFPVYSFTSNGAYSADCGQTAVVCDGDGSVIPTNVFVRIAVMLPGSDEPTVLDNWTGVDTVTILPRPVYVAAGSAEKDYDATPLTCGDYTIAEATATTGFVAGEGASFRMTGDSAITDPGSTANAIDGSSVQPNEGTDLGNYEFHYTDGTLTVLRQHHVAEPLIAEFSLSAGNDALQTMRIWTTATVESGDLIYLCGAKTYADAKAGNWVALTDSECLVDDLVFDDEHICRYKDIVFTAEETAANYRFFLPVIRTWEGDVFPGCKYVGVVDVAMDPYGETAAGVPFARCLSETDYTELAAYSDPDIAVTDLVQTNTLVASETGGAADKLFILTDPVKRTFDWYILDSKGQWNGIPEMDPDTWEDVYPPEAGSVRVKRGTGINIKREGSFVEGVIRLHGQVDETQIDWKDYIAEGGITLLSSGLPVDLDLNDEEDGMPYDGDASITYMDPYDYTYVISYGNPDKLGDCWYRTKTKVVKGKRTTTFVAPPLIPAGRVFWFTDGTTDNPATPVTAQ